MCLIIKMPKLLFNLTFYINFMARSILINLSMQFCWLLLDTYLEMFGFFRKTKMMKNPRKWHNGTRKIIFSWWGKMLVLLVIRINALMIENIWKLSLDAGCTAPIAVQQHRIPLYCCALEVQGLSMLQILKKSTLNNYYSNALVNVWLDNVKKLRLYILRYTIRQPTW